MQFSSVILRDRQALWEQRHTVEISIVMPAYNEYDTIERAIGNIRRIVSATSRSYELIVVDDGSTDGTLERLREIKAGCNELKLIESRGNHGKGSAVRRAAALVAGGVVIVIDSDGEINPSQLEQYLIGLRTFEICIASKRHPLSRYSAPASRKFLSIGFNKMVRLLTGVNLLDTQTGLKAARGEQFARIMRATSVKRFAYDVEFLVIANLLRMKIAEMPVHIQQQSRFSLREAMHMFVDLLGISYRLRITKWYQRHFLMKPTESP